MSRSLLLLIAGGLLAACNSPCQKLCVQMADYAEECGVQVPTGQLATCLEEQKSDQDQGACRRSSGIETLRSEWTCDDVRVFFQ